MRHWKKLGLACGMLLLAMSLAPADTKTTSREFVIVDNDDRNYVHGIIVIYDKPQYRPAVPAWSKRKDYGPEFYRPRRLKEIPIEEDTIIPAGD